jgi:hypothetical protein
LVGATKYSESGFVGYGAEVPGRGGKLREVAVDAG